MNHASRVRLLEPASGRECELDGLVLAEWAGFEPGPHGLSVVERHGDEQRAVGRLPDLVDRADVRVLQAGGELRLHEQPPSARFVEAHQTGEALQRHVPLQLRVPGPIHDAHATPAEALSDLVSTYGLALEVAALDQLGEQRGAERVREAVHRSGRGMRLEQGLHLRPQGVVPSASPGEEVSALRLGDLQCREEEVLDRLPSLSRHSLSSRLSHALAITQSRLTVAGDSERASAVSLMLMPPKNRHSTMRAWRSLICSRRSNAV